MWDLSHQSGAPPQQVLLMSSLLVHSRAPIMALGLCLVERHGAEVSDVRPIRVALRRPRTCCLSFEQHFMMMPRPLVGSRRFSAEWHFSYCCPSSCIC